MELEYLETEFVLRLVLVMKQLIELMHCFAVEICLHLEHNTQSQVLHEIITNY